MREGVGVRVPWPLATWSPQPWPPVRGLWLGQYRAFGEPEAGGRQVPAPRLQSVPLNKKRGGLGGGVRPWRWGPVTHLDGDGMSKMAAPWWPQGKAAMLEGGEPRSGQGMRAGAAGRGHGAGGWAAPAGRKASPLSGPSLSWGVSKEGPRGHGLATVWLAGDETSPNQNQKGTGVGWGWGGHGRNTKTPRSCLQGRPPWQSTKTTSEDLAPVPS